MSNTVDFIIPVSKIAGFRKGRAVRVWPTNPRAATTSNDTNMEGVRELLPYNDQFPSNSIRFGKNDFFYPSGGTVISVNLDETDIAETPDEIYIIDTRVL